MASEWRNVLLEQVASEITVGHVGPMASEYVPEGIPFLRSQNVDYLRISTADIKYITRDFHQRLKKSALAPGDVVIVRTGKPGTCSVVPSTLPEANCSDLVVVRCGEDLDSRYLAYYVNSIASRHVAAHLVGAVQQHFNVGSARKIELRLPTIDEQRAIAHVLGTLDDKIELNRRMNETLEAIAQAIFKSWFIDFDPVRAKASGEPPESICHRLRLTSDILALFPDRLVDSELGEIPEGWAVKPLDGIASYLNGLALQKYPPESEGEWLPVIKIAQLKSGSTVGADRASHRLNPEYIVDDGDVLFSWSGSLEVDVWCSGRGALNQHLFKVTSKSYPKWFFFHWTREHLAHFRAIAAGKAVTMGHIQRKHLTEALCVVPSGALLDKAGELIAPMFQYQIDNRRQSRTLAATRDTLLPKLLSGELGVPIEGSV